MFKPVKAKILLALLALLSFQGFQAFAAKPIIPADYFDDSNGRALSDFTLFDAYQFKSDNLPRQKQMGHIIFLYRDLQTCGGHDICRRLSLAWVSPEGKVIELHIPEYALNNRRLFRDQNGVALAGNNNFNITAPKSLSFDYSVNIQTSGSLGENLTLTASINGNRETYIFERVVKKQSDQTHPLQLLREKLRKTSYYPPFDDLTVDRGYAVYFDPMDSEKGYILGLRKPLNDFKHWTMTEFKSGIMQSKPYTFGGIQQFLLINNGVHFNGNPPLLLDVKDPLKFAAVSYTQSASEIGELVFFNQQSVLIETAKFFAKGPDESAAVLIEYLLSPNGVMTLEPSPDPFYEMLSKNLACSTLLKTIPPKVQGGTNIGEALQHSIGHMRNGRSLPP